MWCGFIELGLSMELPTRFSFTALCYQGAAACPYPR